MNPHFLFNCLTSISGLIKTKEYNKSEIVLNNLAKLMWSILINATKDLITLEEEIKIRKLYLDRKS
ncbi:MAG: histidine kinase [Bacteroidetes bacterium]|nr:histidine kinase [Bacteroidota bacterium]